MGLGPDYLRQTSPFRIRHSEKAAETLKSFKPPYEIRVAQRNPRPRPALLLRALPQTEEGGYAVLGES
jgi:hypothetical protein